MATILVQSLVDQVRLESNLNSSPILTDADIAQMISDGGSDLYDIFTGANQHYNISTFDFTLTGGIGGTNGVNSWDLSVSPGNVQQGHSIDVNPNTPQPYTLKFLSNWLDRNKSSAPYAIWSPGLGPKQYTFSDNKILVFPPTNAAGQYRLYYTPTWTPLALTTTIPVAVSSADDCFNSGGFLAFDLANVTFDPSYVGGTITTTFGAPNTGLNATYTIGATPTTAHYVITTTPYTGQTITLPNSGTATIVVQPTGTRGDLPAQMNPWVEYLKTFASITIRNKRGQDTSAFERRLAILKDRIQTILQERQEEPTQPPLTRSGFGDWC